MTTRRTIALGAAIGLSLVAVWFALRSRMKSSAKLPATSVSLEWSGAFSGNVVLPVDFSWCPINRSATLVNADSGETGLILHFGEADSLHLEPHRVIPSVPNPPPLTVKASFRYVQDSVVLGFVSESGTINLSGTSSQSVSGTIDMGMRRQGSVDTLRVKGSFSGVPVVVKAKDCP